VISPKRQFGCLQGFGHNNINGGMLDGLFPLMETPVFVRAGAIIPTLPLQVCSGHALAARTYDALVFSIFPGASSFVFSVYEDDGMTTDYTLGKYAEMNVSYNVEGSSLIVNMGMSGFFAGQPDMRSITLRLVNAPPPNKVIIEGKSLPFGRYGGSGTWSYDGDAVTAVIELLPLHICHLTSATVRIIFDESVSDMWQDGSLSGVRGAISHANLAKQRLDEVRATPGSTDSGVGELLRMTSVGEVLSLRADKLEIWLKEVYGISQRMIASLKEIDTMEAKDVTARRRSHVRALLNASIEALTVHSPLFNSKARLMSV